jgi:ubiquinone biosynthesis protein
MQLQPQLILLEKTLLNIEGLGRDLYPELDIWSTASPILREWMRERTSLRSFVRELRGHAPELIEALRSLPTLLAARVQRKRLGLQAPAPAAAPPAAAAADLAALREELRAARLRNGALAVGAALLAGGLVWVHSARQPAWGGWLLIAAGLLKVLYGVWR